MLRGLFITFEGTEGAGKSTLIQAVAAHLRQNGFRVTVTREPGGTPLAESLRELILKHEMDPWTELFLYEAARAEHAAGTIRPALARGEIVLCDRFTDSTVAYQGYARGLPIPKIHQANRLAAQELKPQLTVFLDIDPALGLKKAVVRNRFEDEGVAFQKKVHQGFTALARKEKSRFLKLKAMSAAPEVMAAKVVARLEPKLRKLGRAAAPGAARG